MSCQNCEVAQEGKIEEIRPTHRIVRVRKSGKAYYRWKNANIEMNGCDQHLRKIFDALNEIQKNDRN